MVDFVCPHCGIHSTFTAEFYHRESNQGSLRKSKKTDEAYILKCDRCQEMVYEHIDKKGAIDRYPKRIPKLDDSIPEDISADYAEALRCFDVNSYKASVVMCRRSIQNSTLEKGATKNRLIDQIDEIHSNETITGALRDWAHEIRLSGNIGAHPDKDGLKDMTSDEAKEILDFTDEYFNYVYVMPSRVASKRASRDT